MSAVERVWGDLLVVKDKATMDMWRERALKKHKGEEVDRETWFMRGSGARFVWVTAVGKCAVNAPAANKATVAWTAVVRYLKGVAATRGMRWMETKSGRDRWRSSCNCRNRLRHMALRSEGDSEVQGIQEWLHH